MFDILCCLLLCSFSLCFSFVQLFNIAMLNKLIYWNVARVNIDWKKNKNFFFVSTWLSAHAREGGKMRFIQQSITSLCDHIQLRLITRWHIWDNELTFPVDSSSLLHWNRLLRLPFLDAAAFSISLDLWLLIFCLLFRYTKRLRILEWSFSMTFIRGVILSMNL